jgi:hypothetical protein
METSGAANKSPTRRPGPWLQIQRAARQAYRSFRKYVPELCRRKPCSTGITRDQHGRVYVSDANPGSLYRARTALEGVDEEMARDRAGTKDAIRERRNCCSAHCALSDAPRQRTCGQFSCQPGFVNNRRIPNSRYLLLLHWLFPPRGICGKLQPMLLRYELRSTLHINC